MTLADIASGEVDTADLLFLFGAVAAGLSGLFALVPRTAAAVPGVVTALLAAAVCLLCVGFLVL
jgi:hypothetical protein